jgi:hypothetical protein
LAVTIWSPPARWLEEIRSNIEQRLERLGVIEALWEDYREAVRIDLRGYQQLNHLVVSFARLREITISSCHDSDLLDCATLPQSLLSLRIGVSAKSGDLTPYSMDELTRALDLLPMLRDVDLRCRENLLPAASNVCIEEDDGHRTLAIVKRWKDAPFTLTMTFGTHRFWDHCCEEFEANDTYIERDLDAAIERCLMMSHEQVETEPDMVESQLLRVAREHARRRLEVQKKTET